jgi:transposase
MTKTEQTSLTSWRFKVLKRAADSRCVARTCRHFGLSRKTFYKWHRRCAKNSIAGLCDRPRTPHRSPRVTPCEVVSAPDSQAPPHEPAACESEAPSLQTALAVV